MEERLEQIRKRFSNGEDYGDFEKEDIDWLIGEVEKRENYWVDKYLDSLNQNIKLQEDIQIKENHNQMLRKSNREYQQAFDSLEEENKELKIELTKYVVLFANEKGLVEFKK